MRAKNLFLLSLLSFSLLACAGRRPAPETYGPPEEKFEGVAIEEKSVDQQTAEESYGPPEGAAPAPAETAGPPPAPEQPPAPAPAAEAGKLCLILGPGMAKALAQASVLEAIKKAQIPVHCAVGTEMGAVVGALYSQAKGSTNNMQWQLFKFSKENYLDFPVISLREPKSNGRKLHEFLRGIFRNKKIEELPVPFATVAEDTERDATVNFERGEVADALSATLAMPGIFEPWKISGVTYSSGAVASPAPVELARKLGGNFFVLIDVLDEPGGGKNAARFQKAFSPARNLMKLQKKEASFVIQVRTGAIAYDDFGHQGEILAAGARAAEKSVPELKAAWEKWNASTH